MRITDATPADAPFIAQAIVTAISEEHCLTIMGPGHGIGEIRGVFEELARRDDTQYSHRNTRLAVDKDGTLVGACVAYDGALLHTLRRPFLERASRLWGVDTGHVDDETEPGEFYIDTLMVVPAHRGRGIAAALIADAVGRARAIGKPAGLLVDKHNAPARRLYARCGFRRVADRPFMGITMDHLQHP